MKFGVDKETNSFLFFISCKAHSIILNHFHHKKIFGNHFKMISLKFCLLDFSETSMINIQFEIFVKGDLKRKFLLIQINGTVK